MIAPSVPTAGTVPVAEVLRQALDRLVEAASVLDARAAALPPLLAAALAVKCDRAAAQLEQIPPPADDEDGLTPEEQYILDQFGPGAEG